MTVAQFMDVALTHADHGYYMHRDVFGRAGDFVTAPEVSQLFGEIVALWCVSVWEEMGCPLNVRLVELGPGRGTLMQDSLRVMAKWPLLFSSLSVHLVDVSPTLRSLQAEALGCGDSVCSGEDGDMASLLAYAHRDDGVPVSWHPSLEAVPRGGMHLIIAQEFFDALPVHHLLKTMNGWKEKVVQWDRTHQQFRWGVATDETGASRYFQTSGKFWRPLTRATDDELPFAVDQVQEKADEDAPPSPWEYPPSVFPKRDAGREGGVTPPSRAVGDDGDKENSEMYSPDQGVEVDPSRPRSAGPTSQASSIESDPGSSASLLHELRPLEPLRREEPSTGASQADNPVATLETLLQDLSSRIQEAHKEGATEPSEDSKEPFWPETAAEWLRRAPVGTQVEFSPLAGSVAREIAQRIGEDGGGALVIDYGYNHAQSDSLRAIRDHKFVNVLETPGLADLSANVDFQSIGLAAEANGDVSTWGPVTQSQFLQEMGIRERVSMLLEQEEDDTQAERLIASVRRLLHPDEMGRIYKALAILPSVAPPPLGFGRSDSQEGEE